ncbi:hypothetical protein, partial [Staphylococcus haemolyticus]|uniref:hypothetical protein n=1 Tax=Staphylococcus haemolyticus TaxID=1283 RepID=UPI001C719F8A
HSLSTLRVCLNILHQLIFNPLNNIGFDFLLARNAAVVSVEKYGLPIPAAFIIYFKGLLEYTPSTYF